MNAEINNSNIQKVRNSIETKQSTLFSNQTYDVVLTDMDHHPYSRFNRTQPLSNEPHILEREAGFQARNDDCYKKLMGFAEQTYPNHVFKTAPAAVLPVFPEYLRKYSDKEMMETILNNACIVKYR